MKELKDLRNEVLNLRNMGEITKQTENILLNKLNALEEAVDYAHSCEQFVCYHANEEWVYDESGVDMYCKKCESKKEAN